ncbi:MAG: translocation/assembly module TamB domain-containing protein [Xanthomonadales bacterium]|nr:translocation/assembly module TamB domain-containing protein [Xanthomonadales bacterium]
MKTWLKYLLIAAGVLLLLALAGYFWLTRSDAGTRWLLGFAESKEKPLIALHNIKGNINSGIRIGKLRYRNSGTDLTINNLNTQVDYRLFPFTLLINQLKIEKLQVQVAEGDTDTDTDTKEATMTDLSLPLEVELKSLQITQLLYSGSETKVTAGNTRASLQIGKSLNLRELKTRLTYLPTATDQEASQALTAELSLSGLAQLKAPWKHQLELQLIPKIDPANPDVYLQLISEDIIKLNSSGDTRQLQIQLESRGDINLTLSAKLDDLLDKLRWQAQLESQQLNLPLAAENSVEFQQLDIHASGGLQNWQLNGGAGLSLSAAGADNINGNWSLSAKRDMQAIEIAHLGLSGDIGEFDFQGNINPDELSINGVFKWRQLKAGVVVPDWPNQVSSSGHATVDYQNQAISITNLLAVIDDSITRVEGNIKLLADTIDAQLNWENLSWPLATPAPAYRSNAGNLSVTGSLDNYQLAGQFDVSGSNIPTGLYQLEGTGNQSGLHLQRLNSQILEGELTLSGELQWQPQLLAKLKVSGSNINPGSHWNDYNGDLGLEMNLQWQAAGETPEEQLSLQIQQLSGTLRDNPLQASGNIHLLDGNHLEMGIKASSGEALLDLQGKVSLEDPLAGTTDFKIIIPDLGQFISGGSGRINANGQLRPSAEGQNLLLDLQAENINTDEASLEKLSLSIDTLIPTSNSQNLQLDAQIEASKVKLAAFELPIDSLQLHAVKPENGSKQHNISLHVESYKNSLSALLNAEIGLNQQTFSLDGELLSMDITTPVTGTLALQAPAKVLFNDMQLQLSSTCFRQQPDAIQAEFCLERKPEENQNLYTSQLKLDKFPLAWITAFLPVDLAVGQSISGELSASGDPPVSSVHSINGRFELSPGIVASLDLDAGMLETEQGLLEFNFDREKNLSGRFDLPFKVGTGLNLEFNIAQTTDIENARIEGKLKVVLDDLIALKWLLPGLDDLSGTFATDMQIKGRLLTPELEGSIAINDVGLTYTPLGIEISKLNLKGNLQSHRNSILEGSFIVGEGQGDIQVGIDNSGAKTKLDLRITGTDLQLLNAPGLKLKITPDLALVLSEDQLSIEGSIEIPSARITPPPGVISSTPLSDDVVVTGLETIVVVVEEEKTLPLSIHGSVKVSLGDDVHFEMASIETQLTGRLDLLFEGDSPMPTARGSIQLVDGFFRQYGQNLNFLNSEIRFDGKAASNPVLDIYAVRHIFADPEVKLAGIHISGRPDDIRLKLYTDPETDQESAVAYLATGGSFDHGNGVGSLNIGTYIYPKLFVSYGIGLFDTGNEVSARYELTGNWAVQGTSADSGSGVDVLYSIDR